MTDRVYLDNHATTPVDPRVVAAMMPYFTERPGNPSSPHVFGWEAAEAVARARHQIAHAIGCDSKEIVFTSGATESNNLALWGVMERHVGRGRHLVTTAIEHPSVLDVARALEARGFEVDRVPVGESGVVDVDAVLGAIRDDTVLCSVMWANNEIGTIQPVAEIAQGCRERGVFFHTDATQAVGRIPVAEVVPTIDLLSASAHKFNGPKGIGFLLVGRRHPRVRLEPRFFGGGQQGRLRPGTLPTPSIVGLGEACALAVAEMPREAERLASLRDRLQARLEAGLEETRVNGDPDRRLPGNLNMSFFGIEAQAVVLELRDVGVSVGSACSADLHEPSHVLLALGLSPELAHGSLRFGLGRFNRPQEVDAAADRIIEVVRRLRAHTPVHGAVRHRGPAGTTQ